MKNHRHHRRLLVLAALPALALLALAAVPSKVSDELDQERLEAITEEIRRDIEELRGESFPRGVAVHVSDKETFLDYVKKRLAKMTTPEELAAQETTAKLFGLIPAEMDYLQTTMDLLEEQVGGYYDPDSESFYIMSSFGGDLAKVILAHELTHALDDQLYDIDGTLEELAGNSDAVFAFHAVVEGSGTAVMNKWTIANLASLNQGDVMKAQDMGMEAMAEAPPFLWKPLLGTYLRGAAFLARTQSVMKGQMSMPELADFRRAFQKPPRSSEQILHPDKYWDEEGIDEPREVSFDTERLPEGIEVLHEDTMGELGMGLLTESPGDRGGLKGSLAILGTKYTHRPSEGWGGDRYLLLSAGDARILVCKSVWDTQRDADEFHEALGELRAHLEAATLGLAQHLGVQGAGLLVEGDSHGAVANFALWAGCEASLTRELLTLLGAP